MGSARSGQFQARRFSVVGEHASGTRTVRHVGVLQADGAAEIGRPVAVWQMAPPLTVGQAEELREAEYDEHMNAHVLTWLEDLSDAQIQGMQDWIEEIRGWVNPGRNDCPYHVLPAYEEALNEQGTMVRYRRFSCAGFVERCYRDGAGILLVVEEERLPEVGADLVVRVWGTPPPNRSARELRVWPRVVRILMARWGLKGDGPWRLLLPGYLLHAIRGASDRGLPYQPEAADVEF